MPIGNATKITRMNTSMKSKVVTTLMASAVQKRRNRPIQIRAMTKTTVSTEKPDDLEQRQIDQRCRHGGEHDRMSARSRSNGDSVTGRTGASDRPLRAGQKAANAFERRRCHDHVENELRPAVRPDLIGRCRELKMFRAVQQESRHAKNQYVGHHPLGSRGGATDVAHGLAFVAALSALASSSHLFM